MESPHRNPNFTTDRPVAVLMVFLAAIVFGYFSLRQLPVTLMPQMSYPTLTVRTEYPGAAPEEVENDISRRIEEARAALQEERHLLRIGFHHHHDQLDAATAHQCCDALPAKEKEVAQRGEASLGNLEAAAMALERTDQDVDGV